MDDVLCCSMQVQSEKKKVGVNDSGLLKSSRSLLDQTVVIVTVYLRIVGLRPGTLDQELHTLQTGQMKTEQEQDDISLGVALRCV